MPPERYEFFAAPLDLGDEGALLKLFRDSAKHGAAHALTPPDHTEDVLLDVLASLASAVSLLKRGGSDRMLTVRLADYERSVARGLAALRAVEQLA